MRRLAVTAALALAVCATAGTAIGQRATSRKDAELSKRLKGLKPQETRRCLNRQQFVEVRGFDGSILYIAGRDRVYRNDPVGTCAGLKRGDLIVTRSTLGSDVCSGDLVQTRARQGGRITGMCSLGRFTPYTR